jgi:hypothetical protein
MAIKMPDEALPYGEPYYWDQRYNAERKAHGSHYSFDWYCDLEDLWPVIETYGGEDLAATTDRTLVVGCGNSLVSEQLFAKGFSMIWSVDVCASPRRAPPPRRARATPPAPAAGKVVISFMQARYEDNPQLQPGRDEGAAFPTSKAPRSAAVRSDLDERSSLGAVSTRGRSFRSARARARSRRSDAASPRAGSSTSSWTRGRWTATPTTTSTSSSRRRASTASSARSTPTRRCCA